MRILALDTATEACSVALLEGERCESRYEEIGRGHAERILPMVQEVLTAAGVALKDVDAIAVGRGPGAFTGVRIGVSVAQGLAFGAGKRVVPVSNLAALAARVMQEQGAATVLACLDARMQEVYWGVYERDSALVRLSGEEHVGPARTVRLPAGDDWHGAGSGWTLPELQRHALAQGAPLEGRVHPALWPRAQEIAQLAVPLFAGGHAVPPECALPVYLRDRVAHPMSQKSRT